jgi:VWFA-related protein
MSRQPFWNCKLVSMISLAAATAALLAAQAPPASLKILQIHSVPGQKVQVVASVMDAKDHPVKNLGPANFSVKVGKKDVKQFSLERFAEAGRPLSVLLLLDVSGSMHGEAIEAARVAAIAFLDELDKADYCSLTVFGTGARQLVDFTREKRLIRTAIQGLKANESKTWLNQALYDALDRAANAPSSRPAIVVLTDGKDEGSSIGAEDVIAKAGTLDVPIYTLGFGPQADVDFLRRLAALTHGASYATPDPQQLTSIYTQIADQLKNQYLLSLALPAFPSGQYELALSVRHRGSDLTSAQSFPYLSSGPLPIPEERAWWWRWAIAHPWFAGIILAVALALLIGVIVFPILRRRRDVSELPTAPLNVWLEVVKGPADTGLRFPMFDTKLVIGRSHRKADLVLKNDFLVSRVHASIQRTSDGQFVLQDHASKIGTRVNGEELVQPKALRSGDHVDIGQYELLFVDERRRARPNRDRHKEDPEWWAKARQGDNEATGTFDTTSGDIRARNGDRG